MAIAEGDRLPDFDLATGGGARLTAADLRGRRAVLYFYPKDDTPGCTLEAKEFSGLRADFEARGVRIIGVSPDSPRSHDRFIAKCDLGIELVSDPEHTLSDAVGFWVEKSMYGRTYMGMERSSLLVGPDGEVERVWRTVKATGHAAAVLAAVPVTVPVAEPVQDVRGPSRPRP